VDGAVVPGARLSVDPAASDTVLPAGLHLQVVVTADDPVARRLSAALADQARNSGIDVVRRTSSSDGAERDLQAATDAAPDVVVALGAGVVDALDRVSSQNLAQQYLVLGAQLPEPTDNVTAVVWDGATSRGSAASPDGPLSATVTGATASDAVRVGLARVLADDSGVVLDLTG